MKKKDKEISKLKAENRMLREKIITAINMEQHIRIHCNNLRQQIKQLRK